MRGGKGRGGEGRGTSEREGTRGWEKIERSGKCERGGDVCKVRDKMGGEWNVRGGMIGEVRCKYTVWCKTTCHPVTET